MLKKIYSTPLATQSLLVQQNEWENPAILDRNRLKYHSEFIIYNSKAAPAPGRTTPTRTWHQLWVFIKTRWPTSLPGHTYARQEIGNKTDARRVKLSNGSSTLTVSCPQPLSFSTLSVSAESLAPGLKQNQHHTNDIHLENKVYLMMDMAERGVGGDNSLVAMQHHPYRLTAPNYTCKYTLSLN